MYDFYSGQYYNVGWLLMASFKNAYNAHTHTNFM